MARTVNYQRKAEKIKDQIDWLVKELNATKTKETDKGKIKLTDIDFENLDVMTLMEIQARISKIILEKSK